MSWIYVCTAFVSFVATAAAAVTQQKRLNLQKGFFYCVHLVSLFLSLSLYIRPHQVIGCKCVMRIDNIHIMCRNKSVSRNAKLRVETFLSVRACLYIQIIQVNIDTWMRNLFYKKKHNTHIQICFWLCYMLCIYIESEVVYDNFIIILP